MSTSDLSTPVLVRAGTTDVDVFESIFVDREYEDPSDPHFQALNELYLKILCYNKVPVIFDLGANIGLASIWYARKFPMAKVISIEPEKDNFELLKMNTTSYANIWPIWAGISNRKAHLALTNAGSDPWAWETAVDESGEVEAVTIPNLLSREPDGNPLIVKIDIEGFECNLFASSTSWVKEIPVIVFEAHDWLFPWRGTAHSIFSALVKYGQRAYIQRGEKIFSYSHDLLAHMATGPEDAPSTDVQRFERFKRAGRRTASCACRRSTG